MSERDTLAALLHREEIDCERIGCDMFGVTEHNDGADRLLAAGVRVAPSREAIVVEMENEGVVTWGDPRHRARFLEVAPSPDAPGLREAAQAVVDAYDRGAFGRWVGHEKRRLDDLRAALAPRDALDVESLSAAIHASHPHGRQLVMTDKEYDDWLATAILAALAAQSKEPTDGDV